jgi:two-component sensor histidine kinase
LISVLRNPASILRNLAVNACVVFIFEQLKTVFFTFLGFLVLSVVAQSPLARHINMQSGLPSNTNYQIVQDANGYIWLGTDKGLVRYDGKQFKYYVNASAGMGSISDLRIDKKGQLNGQNFSGKHFYVRGDSLYLNSQMAVSGNFSPVLEDSNQYLYYLGFNTVYRSKSNLDTIRFEKEVYSLFEFGYQVYTFDSVRLYALNTDQEPKKIPFRLRGETVFFTGTIQGKLIVFPRTFKQRTAYHFLPQFNLVHVDLPEVFIQSVEVIEDSLVFVSTNNGLYVLDKELRQLPLAQPLLRDKNVSGVMHDAEGALWVSTLDNGIFKFDCFGCLTAETNEPVKVLTHLPKDNKVLCGSSSGKVYEWSDDHSLRKVAECKKRQPITALYRTNNETLFIGGDVFSINAKIELPIELPLAVKKIIPLGNDELALARTGGISVLSSVRQSVDKSLGIELFSNKDWMVREWHLINSGNLRVKNMVYDAIHQQIYAATSIGLVQLNPKSWSIIRHNNFPLQVSDIAIRNDTVFAVTSNTLQLIKNGKVLYEKSLTITSPKHIQVNGDGVWISSGSKLCRFDETGQGKGIFELTNGLEINDFCIAHEDLVMATDVGITSVPLRSLANNRNQLLFHIEQFTANGQRLNIREKQTIAHQDNNLKLIFSVPFYGKQEALRIDYKVNDESWQTMENGLRELNLISLEPGEYNIQFKATTVDGRTSRVEQVLFTICPPFWKTWWFYLLSLLTVAAVAYLLYRYRLNLVQKQNELEKQTITLENKLRESILASVKAQMNPHFIFNSLNTIQSFIYLNDKQQATEYLGKFSQLTRTILEMSNKNAVSLEEEIAAMLLYLDLEKIRFDEGMNFTIEISPDMDTKRIYIPSMIIQPYLENAVKHGLLHKKGERWLKLSFQQQNNMLKVTIDDNGIGRDRSAALNKIKNKQHQSFATQANEKRLDALNRGKSQSVSVKYIDKLSSLGEPQGTTVVLMIAIEE